MAVAGDVDNDGRVDFFLTTVYAGDKSVMYRNLGDWKFEDVTKQSGVATATDLPGRLRRHQRRRLPRPRLRAARSGSTRWANSVDGKNSHLKVRLEGSGKCNRLGDRARASS